MTVRITETPIPGCPVSETSRIGGLPANRATAPIGRERALRREDAHWQRRLAKFLARQVPTPSDGASA